MKKQKPRMAISIRVNIEALTAIPGDGLLNPKSFVERVVRVHLAKLQGQLGLDTFSWDQNFELITEVMYDD